MENPLEIDRNQVLAGDATGLDLFEDDDEFEEFEDEAWNEEEEEKLGLQQWEADWDDDDISDDFSQNLREELKSRTNAEPLAFPDTPSVEHNTLQAASRQI